MFCPPHHAAEGAGRAADIGHAALHNVMGCFVDQWPVNPAGVILKIAYLQPLTAAPGDLQRKPAAQ
ncbi:hypothetical protein D3C71_1801140 [compost metagenome]